VCPGVRLTYSRVAHTGEHVSAVYIAQTEQGNQPEAIEGNAVDGFVGYPLSDRGTGRLASRYAGRISRRFLGLASDAQRNRIS
jgi:hypothetical protein